MYTLWTNSKYGKRHWWTVVFASVLIFYVGYFSFVNIFDLEDKKDYRTIFFFFFKCPAFRHKFKDSRLEIL